MPNRRFFTANQLKAIALFCMLLDHMWATIVPGREWMTCVGRIAFPIFAFELAQGYTHTHDLRAYAKRLLDKDNQGGGGGNDQQNQDQQNRQNQNQQGQQDQDKNQDQQDQNQDQNRDQDKDGQQDSQQGDGQQDPQQGEGDGQPVESGISEQEQQQILDAIQAQEDRTQEKLKEKQGVVVRGRKNW